MFSDISPDLSPSLSCVPPSPLFSSCRDVGANSTVRVTEHFVPTQPGLKKLVVSLDCKQMSQVHGVADILVLEA